MAKNKRTSKSLTITLYIFIFVSIICISIFIYKVYKENIELTNTLNIRKDTYQSLKNDNKNAINNLQNNIEKLNNLNEEIQKLKNETFKNISILEQKIKNKESNKKIVYLTFDDGPYYTSYQVLDTLDKYGIKATFFTTNINGEWCYGYKNQNCHELYKEYAKRNMTIANHTYTHAIHKGLYSSVNSFMDAVTKQENLISNLTGGYKTNILRFPGGSNTAGSLKNPIINALREKGYGYVDWTASDGDGGAHVTSEEAWSIFTNSINEDIEVVLFHDYYKITINLLPKIIEYLQENGYIILPLFYDSIMVNK